MNIARSFYILFGMRPAAAVDNKGKSSNYKQNFI